MKTEPSKFFNRELSWLEFNQRVLNEALDKENPLLERLKFISIVSSNLDEFFMVRVGGLYLMVGEGIRKRDIAGMPPLQQIKAIATRAHTMVADQYRCYTEEIEPGLQKSGFCRIVPAEFSRAQSAYTEQYFESEIFPLLSPIALSSEKRFPLLVNTQLALVCRMRDDGSEEKHKYAIIPIAGNMPRFITLPSTSGYFFALAEDIIKAHIARLFPGEEIMEVGAFRITRNADMAVREDLAADLLDEMKEILSQRKRSNAVRLEIEAGATRIVSDHLCKRGGLSPRDVYEIKGPINLVLLPENWTVC